MRRNSRAGRDLMPGIAEQAWMSEYFVALPDELASRPWPVHGRPRESPRMAREIEKFEPITVKAKKETPLLRHTFETIRCDPIRRARGPCIIRPLTGWKITSPLIAAAIGIAPISSGPDVKRVY